MLNKKGMQWEMIVMAVILLVIMGISLWYVTKGGALFGSKYNQLELQSQIQSCKAQSVVSPTAFDNDFGKGQGDLFSDSCDICLGGNDAVDSDNDGMPDACDKEKTNPPAKNAKIGEVCNGTWDDKKGQCVRQCYTNYMTGTSATPCTRA
jgi:hypothetical protein